MLYNFIQMRKLIDKLNYYTKLYDEGHPAISDQEWDNLYFQLQELEEKTGIILTNSPSHSISYTVVNSLNKVTHNHPMLSLQKTKNSEDVKQFLNNHDGIAMAKMDGLTCSLRYINGNLVSAETRGNGEIGEDITHNIYFVDGVPVKIPVDDEIIIDGEVICTYYNFMQFSTEYANPRNFAAGSIRLLDSKECAKRHLTFIAWDCIKGLESKQTLSDKFYVLDSWGFYPVPYILILNDLVNKDYVDTSITLLKKIAKEESYPIDGVVFKYNNCEYYQSLGYTGHHFRGGLAFKFYDETYSTRLQYIQWTMGRSGQLTPVAVFDPIDIDGTIVEKASLHNVSVMKNILGDCAYAGEGLEVYKANQIIPQIASAGPKYSYGTVIANGGVSVDNIERCPYCNEEVSFRKDGVATICYCDNPNCEGKFINRLNHFCGKKGLDIKGLSKATLEKLINWEWVGCFSDIFILYQHRNEWYKKDGFGVKSVDNILQSIENSKTTELWKLIAAAGIQEIGISASKVLANYYKTWDTFRAAVENNEDFSHLPDFGFIMNRNIHNYGQENWEDMDKVASYITIPAATAIIANKVLDGKVFCITGKVHQWKNRDSLKEYIESLGGKVTGSVTSKTDYLINNDNTSHTSKNLTAQKLNKKILTEENFIALVDELLAK